MESYILHNYKSPSFWFDPTVNYNIRQNKTKGAFGGPPRRKDIRKKNAKTNRVLHQLEQDLTIKVCDWYKYIPCEYKKWKVGRDFCRF